MKNGSEQLNRAQLRQGDVLLVRVGDLPGEEKIAKTTERLVLKFGEVTNHAHAFMADARVGFRGGAQLAVGSLSALKHEEHAPVSVPAGLYDLPLQVEWSDANEPIAVAD